MIDTNELISRLSGLGKKYHSTQQELSNKYHFDENRDVRINVFKHCYIVIDSTYVFLLVRSRHLYDESWWTELMEDKLISENMTEQQRTVFIGGFDSHVISSILVMLLFTVENAFRAFYPLTFDASLPLSFSKLYEKLLPAFGLDNYVKLVKLASLTRNTLHNGSLYIWENDSVEWRDKTYYFEKGKSVNLDDAWSTLTMVTEDLHEMLEKLVKSDTIIQKKEIIDASYTSI